LRIIHQRVTCCQDDLPVYDVLAIRKRISCNAVEKCYRLLPDLNSLSLYSLLIFPQFSLLDSLGTFYLW
jgi:hypothetical protein